MIYNYISLSFLFFLQIDSAVKQLINEKVSFIIGGYNGYLSSIGK